MTESKSPFLTPDEAALMLRISRRTLENMRYRNSGPRWRRHGGRIFYHVDDVLAWSMDAQWRHDWRRRRQPELPFDCPFSILEGAS